MDPETLGHDQWPLHRANHVEEIVAFAKHIRTQFEPGADLAEEASSEEVAHALRYVASIEQWANGAGDASPTAIVKAYARLERVHNRFFYR